MNLNINVIILLLIIYNFKLNAQDFKVEKFSSQVNTTFDEITPVVSRDGKTLYFTRVASPEYDRTLIIEKQDILSQFGSDIFRQKLTEIFTELGSEKAIINPDESDFNQEIWIANIDSTIVKSIEHPSYPLNNALPNSLVSLTPDPNVFYILNQFEVDGGMKKGFSEIRKIHDTSSGWSLPETVTIDDYYTITSEVSLTMSFDGKVLILSATRQDSRDMDLYVCKKSDNNTWQSPKHLGVVINSEHRETTPFLSEDNATLFFSSNKTGNNDIYMSKRLDESWLNWTTPARLSEPINSDEDDSQPYFNMTTGLLFFTSKRDGNSDIFNVKIAPPQATEILVKGRLLNNQTGEVIKKATLKYGSTKTPKSVTSSADGVYEIRIPKGVKFELLAEKSGYTNTIREVYFKRDDYFLQDVYIVDLMLEPLSKNAMILLEPIYFQQSKANILEKSFSELERLYSILQENPNLEIQIEGHTDNNGKPDELIRLSEDRSIAIKTHLVKLGITPNRLKTLGYGSKFPLNTNSSLDDREKNRRVEFRIIKT
jgi:outer membrane protein OmpA-like peptidoglycan-associated protein